MSDLRALQNYNIFKSFVEGWQDTLGTPLLLLSPSGELIASSVDVSRNNWRDLLRRTSTYKPTVFNHSGQTVLAAPLLRDNQAVGFLFALDAREQDAALLAWGADTIMTRLVDEEALQDMTDELIGAWNQLELIYRVTQDVMLTTDLKAALQPILQEVRKVIHTEDAFILLERPDGLDCVTCSQKLGESLHSQTLLSHLIQADHVVIGENRTVCRRIWPEIPAFVETIMATELPVDDDVRAALGLINKVDKNFTAGDTKLLAALAQQVGTIVKNFLLHQNVINEERLSRELEIAAEIQKSLLPTKLPQVGGLSIAVSSIPASEVGGDFYDFVTVDDRHLTLIIGDVAGKGIPAAMLTSVTRTMLRVEAMRAEPPHKIIQQANNVLHQDLSRADSFVTVFVATIDTFEGTLSYASAGHMPAILWRTDTRVIEQLRATSPPIGIFGFAANTSQIIKINSGDTIVFYTDGITEAQAPNGDFFGLNRLLYIVNSRANEPPEILQQYIQSEIGSFRRDSLSRDDATLLIVKMLPQSEAATPKYISTIIKSVEFSYPADIQYLTNISDDIISSCRQLPVLPPGPNADDFIYLIELAISEICTNVIKHAYANAEGEITGCITLLNNGVQLDFYDQGQSFDPNTVPRPNSDPHELAEGGYGLHIVRQIMDVVSYEQHPERGNHWHLIKFLPPTS
jgi:sigma-B regulation protein RsbU (phosphoserine phosphatase)